MLKHVFFYILIPILGLFSLSGCATGPRPTPTPTIYLQQLCEKHHILWEWDSVSQLVTLQRGDLQAKALVGSEIVVMGVAKIVLSAPLKREKQVIIVPPDFEREIIHRFFAPTAVPRPLTYKIIIDAGHGGKDPGAVGRSGLFEKQVDLDIAQRLAGDLEQKGFKVALTRNGDQFISLERRTELASEMNADLFISIHANSCRARGVEGVEVFSLRDLTWSEKKEEQRAKNHQIFFKSLAMEKGTPNLETVLADMLYSHKREKAEQMASQIAQDMASMMDTGNRGHKTSGFFVLRNTLIPAILVEVGFLSNSREEKLLKTSSYRQRIADSLAESIYNYAVLQGF